MRNCKIIFLSFLMVLLCNPLFGQQVVKNSIVGITWKQPMQVDIISWVISSSKTQGTGYVPISSVLYDPGTGIDIEWRDPRAPDIPVKEFKGVFTIPEVMIVQGRMERFYFVANTQWADRVSINSNEIYFDIDLIDLGVKPPVLRLVP